MAAETEAEETEIAEMLVVSSASSAAEEVTSKETAEEDPIAAQDQDLITLPEAHLTTEEERIREETRERNVGAEAEAIARADQRDPPLPRTEDHLQAPETKEAAQEVHQAQGLPQTAMTDLILDLEAPSPEAELPLSRNPHQDNLLLKILK